VLVVFRSCKLILIALLAGLSTECTMVDTVDPRYDSINRATAKARNESILLNIVRASQNAPLNFIAFSKVTGQTAVSLGAALPTFVVGPKPVPALIQRDFTFSNSSLNASTAAINSFDISVLESKDFYNALLSPVDLPTLNFFVRQGYSHELLFWLFTESVRETIAGHTFEYRNEPFDGKSCVAVRGRQRCFRHMVDAAIASGLTVETRVETKSQSDAGKQPGGGRVATRILARLCFDQVLAARAQKEYSPEIKLQLLGPPLGRRPICKIDRWEHESKKGWSSVDSDTLTFRLLGTQYGSVHYEIITRSTFGIYQFLGRILAAGATEDAVLRGPVDRQADARILEVERGISAGCFVETTFNNETYCVPQQGAENTKRIFSLLAQLLALKTQTQDLAITPTVRISP
jgi:hypothetical protein